MNPPRIETVDGRPRLVVDDEPFLILGLQWDCDSCFSVEEMYPLFVEARKMGANTAALPVYWREIEPEQGRYDFTMMNERLVQARADRLRIVVLWFATWKNACSFYAPDYVRNDPATYRLAIDRNGDPIVSLCPTSDVTWQADRNALVALMGYLRDNDREHTAIVLQIENESGLLGTDRCYCAECNRRFTEGGYEAIHGAEAAEAFSVVSFASYIDRLAGEAKAVKNLPTYTNAWLGPKHGRIPGTYPSGGPIPQMLGLYRAQLKQLDFVAPDIYTEGHSDFARVAHAYGRDGKILYVAEHSSSISGRAERNVFYAIGQHGAIGFDPWAIDSPYPDMYGEPLVDPVGHEWGKQAYWLRDSYVAIGRATVPIVEAQGTDKLFTFVQEPGESRTSFAAELCDLQISYHDRENAARGIIVERAPGEFVLIGVGFSVRFRQSGKDTAFPIDRADWGRFAGSEFRLLHPMRRERHEREGLAVPLLEPGVVRVLLNTTHHSEVRQ